VGGPREAERGAMASDVPMSPELEQVDGEIQDIFRALQ
jgi:novel plant SNARE